ncbi:MAG: hypothetical protein LKI30_01505 [Bifidobacterium crudilactis]|nr:hypothetical protein [Bifidobacterium crudilactis]
MADEQNYRGVEAHPGSSWMRGVVQIVAEWKYSAAQPTESSNHLIP